MKAETLQKRLLQLALLASFFGLAELSSAETAPSSTPSSEPPARDYRLEEFEIKGSTRLSPEHLRSELALVPGIPVNDALLVEVRQHLLGLGLFKSAVLLMRRGSEQGKIKLIVDLLDDDLVLTDWAIGGEFGVTIGERELSTVATETRPTDYHFGLVGRNLFRDLHRGALSFAIDGEGLLHRGQLAYGLPRFAKEGTQFDAALSVLDTRRNYLEAMGFGARGETLWSTTIESLGEFQYGAAMYVNRAKRFEIPEFPRSVAGPKFAYQHETRLMGFFPGAGHSLRGSVLLDPRRTHLSVFEVSAAKTFDLWQLAFLTFEAKTLTVGVKGVTFRGESRLDLPIGQARPGEDQAEFFMLLRGGSDHYRRTSLVGSAGILGLRYHSSGFIAEIALKVTRTPEEFARSPLAAEGEP